MQKLLMAIFMVVFVHATYSQVLPTLPAKKSDIKPAPKPKTKSAETSQPDNNTQTIKFTTDAECDIFIDGEAKGHLLAYGFLKTKLGKGQYMLQANGINTSDVLREPFTVDEVGAERLYQINLRGVINNRVATEAANKQAEPERQLEIKKCQQFLDSMIQQIDILKTDYSNSLLDIFCAKCGRSKTMLEKEGIGFDQHLKATNSLAIPATSGIKDWLYKQYMVKFNAFVLQYKTAKTKCDAL